MPSKLIKFLVFTLGTLPFIILFQNCSKNSDSSPTETIPACTDLSCTTLKYSLLLANLDGTEVKVVRTSNYQEMTHPRVSADKNWVAYTAYNDLDSQGCANLTVGYLNTEIRAVQVSGASDKRIIAPLSGQFNSNSYWLGATNEFTYLSGPVTALKFNRATVDSMMNLISGPTNIPVVNTVFPLDPATHLASNKIVFPGVYNPGGGYIKSIFMMNLTDSSGLTGLSVGRDHANTPIICSSSTCSNIMENDPKFSPDGSKVAFMRQAPNSGANGFGWHIFVVPVSSPQNEVDISYSHIGADLLKNDVLPEWIDNTTLLFSTIEITSSTVFAKNVYTMKSDGTQRTKITLPEGYRYSDVFPFTNSLGVQQMIISAEKIGASCTP